MDVSIVIPIYNARDMVEGSIQRLVRVLGRSQLDYEILLRDDGSSDGVADVFRRMEILYPKVKCLYNFSNQGLGFTLRSLFAQAKGQSIVYCDCDLPFGEDMIEVLLNSLHSHDIAVASRYAGISNHVNYLRRVVSRGYYFLCKVLFNIPVVDIGSGCLAMRSKELKQLNLKANGFDIHTELYVRAAQKGLSIAEIPAKARGHKQSSFLIFKYAPSIMAGTLRLYLSGLINNIHYKRNHDGWKTETYKYTAR